MLDPRAVALLGIGYGATLVARIGLWQVKSSNMAGGGMSYEQVLAATLGHRHAQALLAQWRKKKRRGRRAREREMLIFAALP